MAKNRWFLIVAIALVVAAVSADWLWQSAPSVNPLKGAGTSEQQVVQMYAHNIKRWQFDEQGRLQLIVTSPKLLQYQGSERYWLTKPFALVHQAGGAWQVRADDAYADKQYQQVKLLQNVRMQRAQTHLVSENVTLDNPRAKAYSEAGVTLSQGDNTTHAKGFEADFNAQSILLKKQVESYYAPVTRP